jgi:hypothetical protein
MEKDNNYKFLLLASRQRTEDPAWRGTSSTKSNEPKKKRPEMTNFGRISHLSAIWVEVTVWGKVSGVFVKFTKYYSVFSPIGGDAAKRQRGSWPKCSLTK